MNKLPEYVNCDNEEIEVCDYYIYSNLCPNTCGFARDIKGHFVGAVVGEGLVKRLERGLYVTSSECIKRINK